MRKHSLFGILMFTAMLCINGVSYAEFMYDTGYLSSSEYQKQFYFFDEGNEHGQFFPTIVEGRLNEYGEQQFRGIFEPYAGTIGVDFGYISKHRLPKSGEDSFDKYNETFIKQGYKLLWKQTFQNKDGSVIYQATWIWGVNPAVDCINQNMYWYAGKCHDKQYDKDSDCSESCTEAAKEEGRQECINDPLSCGIGKYLIFSSSANPVLESGSSVNVYGNSEINRVTLKSGASAKLINFVGKNEVTVEADSTLFDVSRSGATVTFKDSNGTVLTIPATKTAQTIIFNDKTLTLVINNNQVMLGEQVVNLTPSSIL